MEMKITLNREEIRQIIADKLGVDVEAVDLRGGTTTVGYGMQEHEVPTVSAIVKRKVKWEPLEGATIGVVGKVNHTESSLGRAIEIVNMKTTLNGGR